MFTIFNQTEVSIYKRIQLFDKLVGNNPNYGAEVWGMHLGTDIEHIHNKFCRMILGVNTKLEAMYGELKRVPMYIHRKIILIKY